MSVKYLLDTNVVSALIRAPRGPVAERVSRLADDACATSIIVAAELRYGAAKRKSRHLTAQVEAVLDALPVLPLEPPSDRVYGDLRAKLEAAGRPVGGNDYLIAAQAIALDMILVTDNAREFGRVAGLRMENWVRE